MTSRTSLVLLTLFLIAPFAGSAEGIQFPNTPAGKQLEQYLLTVNSGDRKRLERYFKNDATEKMRSETSLEHLLIELQYIGPFTLLKVGDASPLHIAGVMAAYDEELALNFELEVEANEPHRLSLFKMSVQPQSHLRLNERDLIKALKARLDHWVNENRFSGAVLLARNDRVLFRRAYGFSDRTARTPNTLKTRFRVGSVNKVMTAVAILQLVEDGKLALTDTVGKHIKDLENKVIAEKVTIHQLLTHTGGTGDFFGPDFYAKLGELRSLENYLALDPMRKLEFEPGTRCGYSNYGYVLLGIVIERVSGLNYYDYVRQRVYDPAGMDSSDTPSEDQQVRRRSIGYTKPLGSTVWVPNTNTLPMRGSSAGGGLTTVGDLFRFARGLATNELLSPQYTDLLISAKTSKENACPTPFAYGVVDMRDKDGSGWIGLNGAAEGQNAHWKLYPKSGYSIAVLSNLDLPAADRVANFIDRHLAQ